MLAMYFPKNSATYWAHVNDSEVNISQCLRVTAPKYFSLAHSKLANEAVMVKFTTVIVIALTYM